MWHVHSSKTQLNQVHTITIKVDDLLQSNNDNIDVRLVRDVILFCFYVELDLLTCERVTKGWES